MHRFFLGRMHCFSWGRKLFKCHRLILMKFLMPKIEERKKTSLVHQELIKAWSQRTVLATTFGHAAKKVHIRKLQPYSTAI